MNITEKQVLKQFIESGIDPILDEIKLNIALESMSTFPKEINKREDLYNLSKAIDAIKGKLQESVNDTYDQE